MNSGIRGSAGAGRPQNKVGDEQAGVSLLKWLSVHSVVNPHSIRTIRSSICRLCRILRRILRSVYESFLQSKKCQVNAVSVLRTSGQSPSYLCR